MKDLERQIHGALPPHPYNGQRVRVVFYPGASIGESAKCLLAPEASYEWSSFCMQWDLVPGHAPDIQWPRMIRP